MNLIDLDGLIVDSETGEVIEAPAGADVIAMAAHRFREAKEQAKEWTARAGLFQQVLLRGQETRRAVYGDTVITTRYDNYTAFNADAWREFAEDAELLLAEWRALAMSSRGFDLKQLEDAVGELLPAIARFYETKPKSPFVMASIVTKHAPPNPGFVPPKEPTDGD